jgi:peptidyl-prolyl cis-trans isomerase C
MGGNIIAPCKAVHGPVSREVRNRRLSKPTRFRPFCFADHQLWKLARQLCLSILVAVPALTAGCGVLDHGEGKTVVAVGKRSLTADQLKKELRRAAAEMEIVSQDKAEMRKALLEKVVEQCLILEYGREKGVTISEAELDSVVGDIQKDYEHSDFQEILLKRCMDLEEWKAGLREQILTRKIIEKALESVPAPTAEEIRAYFEAYPQEFKRPAMIKVRQVVSRTKKEAQELAGRLANGERMEELAGRGGEMGWIEKGQVEETIEKVIFSLPAGRISPIVETSYGFHIFQVISRRAEGAYSLPEVASEIERRLISQRGEDFLSEWLQDLERQYPVRIDQKLLEKLEWA